MDLIQALILSFVEGVTEFLPISSTGHLILVSYILNITNTEFVKSFLIIIQLGAILSVVVLYFKMLTNIKIWPKILVGFIPSAAVGLIFYEFIKNTLIGNSFVTVIALFIGGAIFILVEMWNKKREKTLTLDQLDYKNALIALAESFLDSLYRNKNLVRIMAMEAYTHPTYARMIHKNLIQKVFRHFEGYLAHVSKLNKIRILDRQVATRAFFGMIYFYFINQEFFLEREIKKFNHHHVINEFVELFLKGTLKDGK